MSNKNESKKIKYICDKIFYKNKKCLNWCDLNHNNKIIEYIENFKYNNNLYNDYSKDKEFINGIKNILKHLNLKNIYIKTYCSCSIVHHIKNSIHEIELDKQIQFEYSYNEWDGDYYYYPRLLIYDDDIIMIKSEDLKSDR